jgi:beta-galactosidase
MNRNSILRVLLATGLNVLAFGQGAGAAISEPGGGVAQSDGGAATPALVWLESELAKTSFKASIGDWGRPQFLSAGNWIHISVDEDKVEKEVPDQGIVLEYNFQGSKTTRYEVWNRVGFEFVRSSFEWRIDEGAWKKASPDELTTDLMEMGNWCEVAWLKLGDEVVNAGGHRLQIRLSKAKDNKGKWQRVLYASDAICLHEGPFHPNSKFKPGESGRDAADEAAGKAVFQVPDAKASQRASVKLSGVWEIARDDEQMPGEVAEPIPCRATRTH